MQNLLTSTDDLTLLIKANGINTWDCLIEHVQYLPYGRNADRYDFSLVISERKGSCSSKHALLQKVADLNSIPNINLILGIYKMNNHNTPKIGNALSEHSIDYIPEAHCYLKINGIRTDITSINSNFETLEKDILIELEIEPQQVSEFKVTYHQEFLKQWIMDGNTPFDFETIWTIREQCITNLSTPKSR